MNRVHIWFRTVLVATVLAGTVGAFSISSPAAAAPQDLEMRAGSQAALQACRSSAWVTPRENCSWWGQQHCRWLDVPFRLNDNPATVINMRTRAAYRWDNWGIFDGHARIGVPTTYAALNPAWKNDSWIVIYNCN
jgi:hypothetical protein